MKRFTTARSGRAAASIRDVARAAGVSIATVSHTIHGSHPVAAATQARVHAAAAALQYQPNLLARGLRTQKTRSIGMLVAHLRNPLVASYVDGAESVLGERGFSLVLASTHLAAEGETRGLTQMQQLQVDGLIAVSPSPHLLRHLVTAGVDRPVALVNARLDSESAGAPVLAAVVDEAGAGYAATAHLLALGQRRIAFISRGAPQWNTGQRLAGYRRALAEAGCPFDPALVLRHEPPEAPAAALLHRLRAQPDQVRAAYVTHNLVALRLVAALTEQGVAVPQQLALVVTADEDWMAAVRPPLTTIALPARELGAAAARLLLGQVDGTPAGTGSSVMVLRAPLIVRESCGAPPVARGVER